MSGDRPVTGGDRLSPIGGTRLAAVSPIPAVAQTDTVPAVNQVEAHPYFVNAEVCAYNQEYGITTEAWSPLARGRALDEPVVTRIAVASGRSPVQVVLRWHRQRGHVAFPKSVTPQRIKDNFAPLRV